MNMTPNGTPYEEVAMKMANEGLDNFITEGYGATYGDTELDKLCDEAAIALRKIEAYMRSKGVDINEY